MQGLNSSASIWTSLLAAATAESNQPRHKVEISWLRQQSPSAGFAVVDTGIVGRDLVKGVDSTAVTKPDIFVFEDETDNVLSIEYEQEVKEPLGGIIYGQADIVLSNTDLRYTPNFDATIGTAIKPNRPLRVAVGYYLRELGLSQLVNVFKGLSETPREDKTSRTVEIHALDYVSFIRDKKLETSIYQNMRTDEILSDILVNQLGFSSDQFVLDRGLNTIDFAWFTRDETAGMRIKKLVQAEDGVFYQDEHGVLRFENRRHFGTAPHNASVHTIHASDILQWEELERTQVINACRVKGGVRQEQEVQEIWRLGESVEIPAGGSATIWAHFENPVTSITTPVASVDFFANTESDETGSDVSSKITVSVTSFTDAAKLIITNGSGARAYITFFKLRGTPALVVSEIEELYQDEGSIDQYGRHELVVENDFIDTSDFAYYLARAIVRKFRIPRRRVKLTIRAVPQLQVGDFVTVQDNDLGSTIQMRILKVSGAMVPGEFVQQLVLREITESETDSWAIVGEATVGNENEAVSF